MVTVSEGDQIIRPGDIVTAYGPDGYLVKVYGFEGGGKNEMIWINGIKSNGDPVHIPIDDVCPPSDDDKTRLRFEFEVLGY